jgi:hypothetical protein
MNFQVLLNLFVAQFSLIFMNLRLISQQYFVLKRKKLKNITAIKFCQAMVCEIIQTSLHISLISLSLAIKFFSFFFNNEFYASKFAINSAALYILPTSTRKESNMSLSAARCHHQRSSPCIRNT